MEQKTKYIYQVDNETFIDIRTISAFVGDSAILQGNGWVAINSNNIDALRNIWIEFHKERYGE